MKNRKENKALHLFLSRISEYSFERVYTFKSVLYFIKPYLKQLNAN